MARSSCYGCFFHFVQSAYKHHMRLHLRQTTDQTSAARKALKISMALPLLPSYYVANGVQAIEHFLDQNGLGEVFRRFTLYLCDYWLLTVTPERMSVYREEHQTNNFLEGFHSQLKARMGVYGNVWPFICNGNKSCTS